MNNNNNNNTICIPIQPNQTIQQIIVSNNGIPYRLAAIDSTLPNGCSGTQEFTITINDF